MGRVRAAKAPSSIELVEHSTCKFGSQTGDPPALHLGAEPCEQQTGTASGPKRSTRSTDRPTVDLQALLRMTLNSTLDSTSSMVRSGLADGYHHLSAEGICTPPREALRERNFAGEGRGHEHSRVSFAAASSVPAVYPTNSITLSRLRGKSRRHSNSHCVNFTTTHQSV